MSIYKQSKEILKIQHQQKNINYIYRVGQEIYNGSGLTSKTKSAILATFGDNGNKVLRETIQYVIAHRYILPFIEEDPMLICSLGLQVQGVDMPIRWLVSNDKAYINTNYMIPPSTGLYCRFTYMLENVTTDYKIGGSYNGMRISPNSGKLRASFDNWINGTTISVNTPFTITQESGIWECNGSRWNSSKATASTQETYIFSMNSSSGSPTQTTLPIYCSEFIMVKEGDGREMYPFVRDGVNGMIDLLHGKFYTNAMASGSFNISYTLKNGMPWTPVNL